MEMQIISEKPLISVQVGSKEYIIAKSQVIKEHNKVRYHVIWSRFNENEKMIYLKSYAKIKEKLTKNDVKTSRKKGFEKIRKMFVQVTKKKKERVSEAEAVKIVYKLYEELLGLSAIDALMRDEDISYIFCKGLGHHIIIYHNDYGIIPSNVIFKSKMSLGSLIWRLREKCKELNKEKLNGILADGSFVKTTNEFSFSIRKNKYDFGPKFLLKTRTLTPGALAYLWMILHKKKSILIVGQKNSGKTNLVSGLLTMLPKHTKVVIIEDKPNICISNVNWQAYVEKIEEKHETKILYIESHKNPDYFVIDEMNKESANYIFQYLSYYPGIVVLKEKNVDVGINKLTRYDIDVPRSALANFDVAITLKPDRKVREIVEILYYDEKENELVVKPVFEVNKEGRLYPLESRFLRSLSPEEHELLRKKTKEFMALAKS